MAPVHNEEHVRRAIAILIEAVIPPNAEHVRATEGPLVGTLMDGINDEYRLVWRTALAIMNDDGVVGALCMLSASDRRDLERMFSTEQVFITDEELLASVPLIVSLMLFGLHDMGVTGLLGRAAGLLLAQNRPEAATMIAMAVSVDRGVLFGETVARAFASSAAAIRDADVRQVRAADDAVVEWSRVTSGMLKLAIMREGGGAV